MKAFLLIAAAIAFAGCAARPPHVSTNAVQLRAGLTASRAAAKASGAHVAAAQTRLATAADKVTALRAAVPAAFQPAVVDLGADLDQAREDLGGAQTNLAEVETKLTDSDVHAAALQVEYDTQAEQLAKSNAALDAARVAVRHQTWLAWKWRIIALAEILAVAAFFAARQSFPWLKLL